MVIRNKKEFDEMYNMLLEIRMDIKLSREERFAIQEELTDALHQYIMDGGEL